MKGNEEHDRPGWHQQPERSDHGLNERLAAHFLGRLRREAIRLAPADAVEVGILRRDPELAARVHDRLECAHEVARVIVRDQAEAVDFLVEQLFEAGTLEGPELDVVVTETRKRIRERTG